jgi:hypothetical protein
MVSYLSKNVSFVQEDHTLYLNFMEAKDIALKCTSIMNSTSLEEFDRQCYFIENYESEDDTVKAFMESFKSMLPLKRRELSVKSGEPTYEDLYKLSIELSKCNIRQEKEIDSLKQANAVPIQEEVGYIASFISYWY